jgi:hypothetical protein
MEKIIGWLIFFLGLGLILYSLYYSFLIFMNFKNPPDFFGSVYNNNVISEKEIPTTTQKTNKNIQEVKDLKEDFNKNIQQVFEENIQNTIKNEFAKIIPENAIKKVFNLFVFSIFIYILITGGSKIAFLGIQLIKK